jgi:hypothetical protein
MVNRTIVVPMVLIFFMIGMGMAFAGHPDTGPGCGLGKIAWENYPNPQHIGPQVLMATTNGTGFNTIAISSGTSGCTNDGVIVQNEKANVFVASNFDNLAQDMAQGQGEYLISLATLMGVPNNQRKEFCELAQAKYTTLIQNGETSPQALIMAIHSAISKNLVVAKATEVK